MMLRFAVPVPPVGSSAWPIPQQPHRTRAPSTVLHHPTPGFAHSFAPGLYELYNLYRQPYTLLALQGS